MVGNHVVEIRLQMPATCRSRRCNRRRGRQLTRSKQSMHNHPSLVLTSSKLCRHRAIRTRRHTHAFQGGQPCSRAIRTPRSCSAAPPFLLRCHPQSRYLNHAAISPSVSVYLSVSVSVSLSHTHTHTYSLVSGQRPCHPLAGPGSRLPGPVPTSRARFPPAGPGAPPLVIGVRQSLGPASPSAARAGPGSGRPRPAAPTRRWPPRTPPRPHRPPRAQQRPRRSPAGASLAHARTGVSAGKAGRGAAKGRARVQHP